MADMECWECGRELSSGEKFYEAELVDCEADLMAGEPVLLCEGCHTEENNP